MHLLSLSAVVSANANSLDDQIDARRARFGGQFGREEHRRSDRGESNAHWKRTNDRPAAAFVLEAIDQRLQSFDAAIGRHLWR